MVLDQFFARYQYQSVNSLHLKKVIFQVGPQVESSLNMATADQTVTLQRKRNFFSMGRGLKAFLSQRKVEDLCFFGVQYFQSGVFLFSAPNKAQDFYSEIYISKVSIYPVLKSL